MERIKVQSTKKQYLVVDNYDNELGVVTIDLSDVNMAKRAEVAKENIATFIDQAKDLADNDNMIDEIVKIDKSIKEELNTMFNYDISSVVFGETSCMSTIGGVMFVEKFLEAVVPIIEQEFEKEGQASAKRVSKYTERYHK